MTSHLCKDLDDMEDMEGGQHSGSEEDCYIVGERPSARSPSSSSSSSDSCSSRSHSRNENIINKYNRNSPSLASDNSSRGMQIPQYPPPPAPPEPPTLSMEAPPPPQITPNKYPQGPFSVPVPFSGEYQDYGENFQTGKEFHPRGPPAPPEFFKGFPVMAAPQPPIAPQPPMAPQPPLAPQLPMAPQPPIPQNYSGPYPAPIPAGGPPGQWGSNMPAPPIHHPIIDGRPGIPVAAQENLPTDPLKQKQKAIEEERYQQNKKLSKQRKDYIKKKIKLSREKLRLELEEKDLQKNKSKENEAKLKDIIKTQDELEKELSSVDYGIEMLTKVIGDAAELPIIIRELTIKENEKFTKKEKKAKKKKQSHERSGSRHRERSGSRRRERSGSRHRDRSGSRHRERSGSEHRKRSASRHRSKSVEEDPKAQLPEKEAPDANYIYYDPGLHWCSDCHVFPKTIPEYLNHLHSEGHKENSKLKFADYPWHCPEDVEEKKLEIQKHLPVKRVPIRGTQFLVPSTAWFCNMCKVWLGDSHCASKHLQGEQHTKLYKVFTERNPHWEVDWLTERMRAYERISEMQQQQPTPPPTSEESSLQALSSQILTLLAQSKGQDQPFECDKKHPKKKKKKDKRQDELSLKDEVKVSYKSTEEIKVRPFDKKTDDVYARREGSFSGDKKFSREHSPQEDEYGPKKKKNQEENHSKYWSREYRENPSSSRMRDPTTEEQLYNDHDEAVVFERKVPHFAKPEPYQHYRGYPRYGRGRGAHTSRGRFKIDIKTTSPFFSKYRNRFS